MATKPFDLSEPDSIQPPEPPVSSVVARMVTGSISKYVDYLVAQADKDVDQLIRASRNRSNNQMIDLADQFYERIPEEHR